MAIQQAAVGTPVPRMNGRDPVDDFLSKHRFLEQEVARLKQENADLMVQRDTYANTLGDKIEEYDGLRRAHNLVVRYAQSLRTRLKMIRETIAAAEQEATEFAYVNDAPSAPPKGPSPEQREEITQEDIDTAQRIVSGPRNPHLPQNQM